MLPLARVLVTNGARVTCATHHDLCCPRPAHTMRLRCAHRAHVTTADREAHTTNARWAPIVYAAQSAEPRQPTGLLRYTHRSLRCTYGVRRMTVAMPIGRRPTAATAALSAETARAMTAATARSTKNVASARIVQIAGVALLRSPQPSARRLRRMVLDPAARSMRAITRASIALCVSALL